MKYKAYITALLLAVSTVTFTGCSTATIAGTAAADTEQAAAPSDESAKSTDSNSSNDKSTKSTDSDSSNDKSTKSTDSDSSNKSTKSTDSDSSNDKSTKSTDSGSASDGSVSASSISQTGNAAATEQEFFSERDLDASYDTASAVSISLNNNSITAKSQAVTIKDQTVTITKEGTYILSGTLTNGSVIIDTDEEAKVQLVLNGVNITSKTFAPIYVVKADKVFVTLAKGTENVLANGGSFTQIDDHNVDGVIFARNDLTLNGSGSLTITAPAGHGIVGKDEVVITGGEYTITSAKTCIRANDSIAVAEGTFHLKADTDGFHAEKNEDDSLGCIYIAGGTYDISCGDDGIHAITTLTINGGTFNITAAEGLEGTLITINDGDINIAASDDGINAARKSSLYTPTIEINGGNTKVVMGAGDTDGLDANGNIVINGGTVDVTGGSTFDFDGTGTINGGTVISNGQQITELTGQMGGGKGGNRGFGNKGDRGNMTPGTYPGMKDRPGKGTLPDNGQNGTSDPGSIAEPPAGPQI